MILEDLETEISARASAYGWGMDPKAAAGKSPHARALEAHGWEAWLRTLAPNSFTAPFSEEHREFWELFWSILQRKTAGEEIPEHERNILLILSRGLGKSTSAEMAGIAEGCILDSGLCLYLSDTQILAEEHLFSIKDILQTQQFARYYPTMSRPKVLKAGSQAKFTQDAIICENGWAATARGITANVRGGRVGTQRFSLVIADDIDNLNDSLMVIEKKKRILSRTVYPAMSKDGISIFAQNVITKNSVASQIVSHKTDILSNRTVIGGGPVKAFKKLELESVQLPNGQIRWNIKACDPTWPYFSVTDAKSFLAKSGKEAFLAEYQHEFESKQGKVIPNYNEEAQIITWSAFERVFGERRIPQHWKAAVGLDVGYSDGMHPHYSAWVFIAVAAMNSPLAGAHFIYRGRDFIGTSIDDQAEKIKREIEPTETYTEYEIVKSWQMSHERTGEMLTLNQQHSLPFSKFQHWKNDDGVAQWNNMSICDHSKPNPFNEDVKDEGGEWMIGRPQLFYIVDDDQVLQARDERGLKLMREQVSGWEYVPTELTREGLTVEKPSKVNDDYCDAIKALLKWFGMEATPLTPYEEYQQKLAAILPDRMKDDEGNMLKIPAVNPAENQGFAPDITLEMAHMRLRREMERDGIPDPFEEPAEYGDISDGW